MPFVASTLTLPDKSFVEKQGKHSCPKLSRLANKSFLSPHLRLFYSIFANEINKIKIANKPDLQDLFLKGICA